MAPSGWIAVFLLWILFFWFYRDYRLDYFRQRLFGLRDELFDLGLSGRIEYSSKAYGMLRSTINGVIQYGHQWGFLRLVCVYLLVRRVPAAECVSQRYRDNWDGALQELEPDVREQLKEIRTRMHLIVAEQLIFTSFVLMFTLVAAIFAILLVVLKKVVITAGRRALATASVNQLFAALDGLALTTLANDSRIGPRNLLSKTNS